MKFPSIQQLWLSFTAVCNRFTLPIVFALIATIAGLTLTYELGSYSTEQLLVKLIYLSNFGLALSLAVCLYAETKSLKKGKILLANAAVFLVLLLVYFILNPNIYQADVIVLLVLGFAFHLLVAIAAFTAKEENNGFWQINKTFFLRFATSALYSAVLFIGLSIALLSIHTLFDVKWNEKVYLRLWIVIVGLFNTTFFLSDIKKPLKDLNLDNSYPKGLKVFTQYVLIPLSTIYLAILLAYEIKIALQWSLPESSVAILILGYAVFGILSILLVHPIRNNEGNKWIHLYSKSFYLLMLPLLILLAASVTKRVLDYGITESRYLLIVLGLWLTFITIYFLIKGRDQIRVIPISLLLVALLIVAGPWGIKAISKNSQTKRLAFYVKEKPSKERDNEIRNLVRYLNNNFGSETLQPFVKIDLNSLEQKLNADTSKRWEVKYQITDTILYTLKVDKFESNDLSYQHQKTYTNIAQGNIDVKGAVKIVEFNSNISSRNLKAITFAIEKDSFNIKNDKSNNLEISLKNQKVVFDAQLLLNTLSQIKNLKKDDQNSTGYFVNNSLMSLSQNIGNYTIVCRFENLNGYFEKNKKVNKNNIYYSGYLIIYPL